MKNTATIGHNSGQNDKNQFFKNVKVDGLDTPYPPNAPAYCTRSSLKDMQSTSEELTKKELQKLYDAKQTPLEPLTSKSVKCVPAIEFNPDMHRIMCRYAEQICEMNTRLQKKHDEIMKLREDYKQKLQAVEDELSHISEINEGNEEELEDSKAKCKRYQKQLVEQKKKQNQIVSNQPFCIFLYILLYTAILFYCNYKMDWQLTTQYSFLHKTTVELINAFSRA